METYQNVVFAFVLGIFALGSAICAGVAITGAIRHTLSAEDFGVIAGMLAINILGVLGTILVNRLLRVIGAAARRRH